jgi:hypothetical protein
MSSAHFGTTPTRAELIPPKRSVTRLELDPAMWIAAPPSLGFGFVSPQEVHGLMHDAGLKPGRIRHTGPRMLVEGVVP